MSGIEGRLSQASRQAKPEVVVAEGRIQLTAQGGAAERPRVTPGTPTRGAPAPVVAVPTSAGYGTSLGGVTALLAMLSSCAQGVTVVGIDNGFGAACAVTRLCNQRAGRA